ncbi:MAG: phage protein Gp36 family protein [Sodalis sp. (in: enterobacteria)]|uniref:phage protein Gp36 family protein n=1 Tax=Sodalis sp. (in: enterobacteria) TaxID=1898979 RepID=UPI003F312D5B
MYARLEDMVLRFGEQEVRILTDRDNTGEIDATALAGGLQAAADEINGYIRRVLYPAAAGSVLRPARHCL